MLMVIVACLVVLSMADYRVADSDTLIAPLVEVAHLDEFVGPPEPEATARNAEAAESVEVEASTSPTANRPVETTDFVGPPLPPTLTERDSPVALASAGGAIGRLFSRVDDSNIHTVSYTRELTHEFRWGESFAQVLGKIGVHPREVDEWVQATSAAYDLDRVYAGQEVELALSMPTSDLQRLRMEIDPQTVLVVAREKGEVVARKQAIPYDRRIRAVSAEIQSSLYLAAQAEGVPDKIISDVAEVLGWDLNFASEVEPGAKFRVVYEEMTRPDTMETMPGRVLAVDLENRGKRHEGFYFALPDGSQAGYYDRNGQGLGRTFLRYPVAFSRISSNFSTARFHPILKRRVPHYGVDFAAPTGTPVKAVSDGRVLKAGWHGGNGRFVKIRHNEIYETGYSHLSRIAAGVRPGGTVRRGQIIGYVGSTGLATGPHLHFAMYRNARYVDPLRADLPRSRSLVGSALVAFRSQVSMVERAYAGAERDEPAQIATAWPPAPTGGSR